MMCECDVLIEITFRMEMSFTIYITINIKKFTETWFVLHDLFIFFGRKIQIRQNLYE